MFLLDCNVFNLTPILLAVSHANGHGCCLFTDNSDWFLLVFIYYRSELKYHFITPVFHRTPLEVVHPSNCISVINLLAFRFICKRIKCLERNVIIVKIDNAQDKKKLRYKTVDVFLYRNKSIFIHGKHYLDT